MSLFVTLPVVSMPIDIFHIGKFCFLVQFFKKMLLRNCAVDFVEICKVCAGRTIIKAAKKIINSDKMCRSYSDLNFGVTFYGTQCTIKKLLACLLKYKTAKPLLYTVHRTRNQKYNFQKLWPRNFIFVIQVHLLKGQDRIRVIGLRSRSQEYKILWNMIPPPQDLSHSMTVTAATASP